MKTYPILSALLIAAAPAIAADMSRGAHNFYASDQVTTQKVTFKNQYNLTVSGNLFVPKNVTSDAKLPAIVVGQKPAAPWVLARPSG